LDKTASGKITVLYITIFKLLDTRREDKRFCNERQQAFSEINPL